MAERGRNWTDEEISALLAIWSEDRIQRQLLGTIRNATVFRTISNKMQERGSRHFGSGSPPQPRSTSLLKKMPVLRLASALALPFVSCRPSSLQCSFCGVAHVADATKAGHK